MKDEKLKTYREGDRLPGRIGRTWEDSEPAFPVPPLAPEGAPNILERARAYRCEVQIFEGAADHLFQRNPLLPDAGSSARFMIIVHHNDAAREYAYGRQSHFRPTRQSDGRSERQALGRSEHEGRLENDLPGPSRSCALKRTRRSFLTTVVASACDRFGSVN